MQARILIVVCLGILLLSCGGGEESLPVRNLDVIYRGQQCPPVTGDMALLDSRQALDRFLDAAGTGMTPNVPAPDFSRELVLVVAAGQKSTAGYSVGLASAEAPVTAGQLQLPITLEEPGDVAAQVITSPCLVLSIDSRGIESIKRLDTGATLSL